MTHRSQRSVSALAVACLVLPGALIAGCGSGGGSAAGGSASAAGAPAIDASRGGGVPQVPMNGGGAPPRQGMSGKTKVALLVGAAALYYMYNKNKQKRAQAGASAQSEPQYYISKNGRVYYRQPNGQAVWVTPPPQGIPVPEQEAQQYAGYQGYNNAPNGRTLEDLVNSGGYQSDPRGDYSGAGAGGGRGY